MEYGYYFIFPETNNHTKLNKAFYIAALRGMTNEYLHSYTIQPLNSLSLVNYYPDMCLAIKLSALT